MELKTINDWVLSKAYKSVPGVADMSGFGGPTMQYQVLIDPTRLAGARPRRRPTSSPRCGNNNGNAGGGFYSEGGQFYYVRGLGRLETPEDIGNIVLAVRNGDAGAGEGRRPGRDRRRRRASDSSASTALTTPSRASS